MPLPIIAFFTSGFMRWIALAAAITLGVLMLRMHWMQAGRDALTLENQAAAVRIIERQGAVTERVVNRYIKVKGETETKIQEVEKEVIKYAENNTGMCLDVEWRRLHDAAAANAISKGGQNTPREVRPPAITSVELRSAYSLASVGDGGG